MIDLILSGNHETGESMKLIKQSDGTYMSKDGRWLVYRNMAMTFSGKFINGDWHLFDMTDKSPRGLKGRRVSSIKRGEEAIDTLLACEESSTE